MQRWTGGINAIAAIGSVAEMVTDRVRSVVLDTLHIGLPSH